MKNRSSNNPPYLLILGGLIVGLVLNIAGLTEKVWSWVSPPKYAVSEDYFLFDANGWHDGADAFHILLASMSNHRIMFPRYFTRSRDFFKEADEKFCNNLSRARFFLDDEDTITHDKSRLLELNKILPSASECISSDPVMRSQVMLYTIRNLSGESIHGLEVSFAQFANGTEIIEWDDEDGLRISKNDQDCLVASLSVDHTQIAGLSFALENSADPSTLKDAPLKNYPQPQECLGDRGPNYLLNYPATLAPGEALMIPIFTVHYPEWVSQEPRFKAIGPFVQNSVLLPLSVTSNGSIILENSRSMGMSLTLHPYHLSGKG